MTILQTGAVTVLLTEEHLRKIIGDRVLTENELGDWVKVTGVVQKLLDSALSLPDRPWHDWNGWGKGLE
jgi:hypothetical protein